MRWSFDKVTGYGPNMNEGVLSRIPQCNICLPALKQW